MDAPPSQTISYSWSEPRPQGSSHGARREGHEIKLKLGRKALDEWKEVSLTAAQTVEEAELSRRSALFCYKKGF